MRTPTLILLRSDEPHHEALERLLQAAFDLRAVVVEPGKAQLRALLRRGRRKPYYWRLYHIWRRKIMGSARFRRRFFASIGASKEAPPRTLIVDSINDPQTQCLLETCAHDWVIVIGTSILKPKLLSASPRRFINLHGGCLPEYRGNHCVFHAYISGRKDCLATTIHFVDQGIDTGDIIAVCRSGELDAPLFAGPEYFYCRAELLAFNTLIELIDRSQTTALNGIPQSPGGRTFRTDDRRPHHELFLIFAHARHVWRRLTERHRPATDCRH
jgi:methionyl-tRNA formyltransferase